MKTRRLNVELTDQSVRTSQHPIKPGGGSVKVNVPGLPKSRRVKHVNASGRQSKTGGHKDHARCGCEWEGSGAGLVR